MKDFIVTLFLSFSIICCAASIRGKITKVYDGDTIKIEDSEGGKFKVRLADIDAPELKQPKGDEARDFLVNLVVNKVVSVRFLTIDMYGRIVGTVHTLEVWNTVNVNEEMVKHGHAWYYADYSKNEKIKAIEKEARNNKRGLWKQDKPQEPWKYRQEQRRLK